MITFPSFQNLFDAFVSKFKEKKPTIDPTVEGNWSYSFGQGISAIGYALVIVSKQLIKQFFPQTATGIFLDLWGSYEGLERLDPSGSIGNIVVTGVDTTVITANEYWQGSNGVFYENATAATIQATTIVIDELLSASAIATATTTNDHNLASGMEVVMSGATQPNYNGTFVIIVTAADQFTYEMVGSAASPATGSPQGAATFASVSVQSTSEGSITNLNSGGTLIYQGSIVGVDADAITDFFGLQGGAEQEDTEAFRSRILLSRSAQEGVFTKIQIELAALLVNGNTRVYVQTPNTAAVAGTDSILPGQVKIFPLRDNDDPITPGPSILTLTKQSVIDNGKLPGSQWEADVFVLAATLLDIGFQFTELTPNTGTMRNAIRAQLDAYFTDTAEFGTDIDVDVLRGVIIQTQDLSTSEFIESFDFAVVPTPVSGKVPVDFDELPVLGITNWPT